MKSVHYISLVSCVYLLLAMANLHLKFTHLEIIQVIWVVSMCIPLNRWLAQKLGIKS